MYQSKHASVVRDVLRLRSFAKSYFDVIMNTLHRHGQPLPIRRSVFPINETTFHVYERDSRSKGNCVARWTLGPLESRLMLAGDAGAAVAELSDVCQPDSLVVSTAEVAAADSTSFRRSELAAELAVSGEIAFVDADVEASEALAALIRRGVDVALIDNSRDPLAQIGEVLRDRQSVSAMHIISHGEAGQLRLAGELIDTNRLLSASSELQSWRSSLAPDADILLYGCHSAAGEIGNRFIQTWSRLTGADVAGSTDRTGNACLGGDWVLELQTGQIDAELFASAANLRNVQVLLPITLDDPGSLPDYDDFSSISGLALNGDARQTDNTLELTNSSSQTGSAFFTESVSLADEASFESSFAFQILGGSGGADGLAFVIQNDAAGATAIGSGGSDIGYGGISNSIAIEFDTFKWRPFELNNNHVAVNAGSFSNELAVADAGFDLNDGSQYYAWVDFDGSTNTLSVHASSTNAKPASALLQTTVDLESTVGSQAFFGFTSGTGGFGNSHRILQWQLGGDTASSGPGRLNVSPDAITVDEDAGTVSIDVVRSGGRDGEVTVEYVTADGTGVDTLDYQGGIGTITFVDGDSVETIEIPIIDDLDDELDEYFTVALQNATGGATLGTETTTTVTILDNDEAPVPGELAFATSGVTVDEAAGEARIDVVRSGGSDGLISVAFSTFDGTATEPQDYITQSGTLTFVDGDTTETIVIPIIGDDDIEPDEYFGVTLQDPTGGASLVAPASATVTILANGPLSIDYPDFTSAAGLSINGDARQSGNVLELTGQVTQQAGSAFSTEPISLGGDVSFQSSFAFEILGGSGGCRRIGVCDSKRCFGRRGHRRCGLFHRI